MVLNIIPQNGNTLADITVLNIHYFSGLEAKKVFDEAKRMLNRICETAAVQARGVIGLFPAYSIGDDVIVFNETKTDKIGTLYGLRQQVS